MSKYVREVKAEIEFDGDKYSWVLKPLKFEDTLQLRSGNEGELLVRYAGFVGNYIVQQPAVLDADGAAVPLEEVLTATYFAPMVAQLMREHVKAARPSDPTWPVERSGD